MSPPQPRGVSDSQRQAIEQHDHHYRGAEKVYGIDPLLDRVSIHPVSA